VSSPWRSAPAGGRPGTGYGTPPPGPRSLWHERPGRPAVFRHPAPLVLWWVWAVFALVNVGYLIADGLDIHSVRALAVLLAVSGVMYACTLHSRVEASEDGVTIYNPLRQHHAPWAAVTDVRLGQSVEFACVRPAPRKPATIYSWALYSSSRGRARSEMHSRMFGRGQRGISARAPAEAAALAKQHPSQLMADELGRRAAIAQPAIAQPASASVHPASDEAGANAAGPSAALRSSISWLPVGAIVAPAVFVLIAFLIR
jgi:Bacterial PH domain